MGKGNDRCALEEVMTAAEAAEKWGLNARTVQQSCTGYKGALPRFTEEEARKAGRIWLVTKAGMERLYGPEEKNPKSLLTKCEIRTII
ncbi:helix-turn-helix domain-containing protein [Acidaminococcus sp.]|uniref:helix-turn-helix domain-containing protein n=1 Tax=Acidaminococcus sp. TaxID=1872103 RepID=UPI003D7F156F